MKRAIKGLFRAACVMLVTAGMCAPAVRASTETRDLKQGWSLVSFSNTPVSKDLCSLLQKASAGATAVDITGSKYTTCGSGTIAISPGRAYWVFLDKSATLSYETEPATGTITVDLEEGWNIIGPPPCGPIPLDDEFHAANPKLSKNGKRQNFFTYDPDNKKYGAASAMNPGEGYLVYAEEDCSITIQPPPEHPCGGGGGTATQTQPVADACTADSDCDDGDATTADACVTPLTCGGHGGGGQEGHGGHHCGVPEGGHEGCACGAPKGDGEPPAPPCASGPQEDTGAELKGDGSGAQAKGLARESKEGAGAKVECGGQGHPHGGGEAMTSDEDESSGGDATQTVDIVCPKVCQHTASCTVACTSDAGCDDGNSLTTDVCNNAGTCDAACSNTACTVACAGDTDCNDNNALTIDTCSNAGTCQAACNNTVCAVSCVSDSGCDDGDALTIDVCNSPNTCEASCGHTACTPACTSDADCTDSDSSTQDTCANAGTCDAACKHYESACTLTLDKVNYAPGDVMTITFTASNVGTEPALCGAQAWLKRDSSTIQWNSFNESLYITIPAGAADATFVIQKTVPETWIATDSSSGSDYEMDTVHPDGTTWEKGDNFNVHASQ